VAREIGAWDHKYYSEENNKVLLMQEWILKQYDDYDDLMFTLADSSSESILTVKKFTVAEVISFNKRLIEKARRQKNARGSE